MIDEYGLCLCNDFDFEKVILVERRNGSSFEMVFRVF